MTEDFDADAFAAVAAGDDPVDGAVDDAAGAENHAAAEGAEPSDDVGAASTLREMLLSTEPSPSLEETESPWDPDHGGVSRVWRGLRKALDIDGMPAAADVLIGVIEELSERDELVETDGSDDDAPSDDVDDTAIGAEGV